MTSNHRPTDPMWDRSIGEPPQQHWTQGIYIDPKNEDKDRVCWCWPKIQIEPDALIVIHNIEDRSEIDL